MAKTIPNEEKVFMVSKNTNTTYSGSAALKAMSEWYTMEDVSNTVKPYKVFTALLTQSGGSGFGELTSGNLTIGVTYFIQLLEGADFSNVGGSNIEGTYFIATGITPNSWGTGGQLEYNTGAPVATVLENTIGNVWFGYSTQGMYTMNSNSLFTSNKTIGFAGGQQFGNATGDPVFIMYQNNVNEIGIDTPSGNDYYLNGAPIEIRVYN